MGSNLFKVDFYFRNIADHYGLGLSPSIIGYEACQKTKPAIVSNKSAQLLHFVFKGKGYISSPEGRRVLVSPRECFLIEAGTHVRYEVSQADPWAYAWLELNGDMAKKLCESAGFKAHHMHMRIKNWAAIEGCLEQMFESDVSFTLSQQAETLRIESLVYRLFSVIINEYGFSPKDSGLSAKQKREKEILAYIESNCNSPDLSVAKIAEHFHFDPTYFTRMFKEAMGASPIQYIISLRMRKAVELLSSGQYTISQIANALGYKNQFYFSMAFKKHYKVPPTRYRKETTKLNSF